MVINSLVLAGKIAVTQMKPTPFILPTEGQTHAVTTTDVPASSLLKTPTLFASKPKPTPKPSPTSPTGGDPRDRLKFTALIAPFIAPGQAISK